MKYVGPELTKPMSMLKFIQKLPLLFSAYSEIHTTDLLDQIGSNSATRHTIYTLFWQKGAGADNCADYLSRHARPKLPKNIQKE